MLSANEIAELEKKFSRYQLKQRIHTLILAIMVLLIFFLSLYLYPDFFPEKKSQEYENISSIVSKNVEQNLSQENVEKNTTLYSPPPVATEREQERLALKLPIIEDKTDKKQSYSGVQEEEIESKIFMRKPSLSDNDFSYKSKEESLNTSLLPPPLMEPQKEIGMIKIETKDVNSLQYLKERFDKTHNIVFALMLAEEYYKNKNYNESNKWALIANNMDSENEKSWIWFAKSKLKLGQKEDAIVALQAYLKNNKSKAAQGLLHQINNGAMIE
ncbi:MAG: CDC27 family protein [Campylobacterales bacterium]|nr:CDC27 family protein [Campylobacterales bacterium]MBN2831748.1 CDC27 family protein [Campylobacterales bacterium]